MRGSKVEDGGQTDAVAGRDAIREAGGAEASGFLVGNHFMEIVKLLRLDAARQLEALKPRAGANLGRKHALGAQMLIQLLGRGLAQLFRDERLGLDIGVQRTQGLAETRMALTVPVRQRSALSIDVHI